jgi:hypothetical protein
MAKIFGGLIIGSVMILMILGGGSAANQMFFHIQQLYLNSNSQLHATNFLLIGLVTGFLGVLSLWPAKPALNPKQVIRGLRRHCS